MQGSEEQAIFNEGYYKRQFELVKFMHRNADQQSCAPTEAQYTVADMVEGTDIGTADEVLRALYIMEGQKMVTPFPIGDFTSSHWCLTDGGADIASKLIRGVVDLSELW